MNAISTQRSRISYTQTAIAEKQNERTQTDRIGFGDSLDPGIFSGFERLKVLVPRQEITGADRQWAEQYQRGDIVRYTKGGKVQGIPSFLAKQKYRSAQKARSIPRILPIRARERLDSDESDYPSEATEDHGAAYCAIHKRRGYQHLEGLRLFDGRENLVLVKTYTGKQVTYDPAGYRA